MEKCKISKTMLCYVILQEDKTTDAVVLAEPAHTNVWQLGHTVKNIIFRNKNLV